MYDDVQRIFYIYSHVSKRYLTLPPSEVMLINEGNFLRLNIKTIEDLMDANLIVPEIVEETEIYVGELLIWDKITVVLHPFIEASHLENLWNSIKNLPQTSICFLLVQRAPEEFPKLKTLFTQLNSLQKEKHLAKEITILLLEYSSPIEQNTSIYIKKPSIKEGDTGFEPVYTHYILKNPNITISPEILNTKSGVSNFTTLHNFKLSGFDSYSMVKPKSLTNTSVVMSNEKYFKELPISGFIIDAENITTFSTAPLHSTCYKCPFLVNCGGYLDAITPVCPSYAIRKEPTLHTIKNRTEKDAEPITSIVGVSNSLILKQEVIDAFEKMILLNASPSDILKIKYLSKEYNKGFHLAKQKQLNKAKNSFHITDELAGTLLDPNNFSYYYTQTFATSTKSYLKFKQRIPEEAITITQAGIKYATLLQPFKISEIMALFVSQMLMNMAKVYRLSKKTTQWYLTTLSNIHFLLNFTPPDSCPDFDTSHLKKVPQHLRYFMLLEVIDEVLIDIIKNQNHEGKKLITAIQIHNLSEQINQQIDSWIYLNALLDKNQADMPSFQGTYATFMNSENDVYSLATLKLFIRNRVRKEKKQLHQNILQK